MNYFKPWLDQQNPTTALGRRTFNGLGCNSCHMPDLQINHDRRVADVETVYDPTQGIFNKLFAAAGTLINVIDDRHGLPPLKLPQRNPFPGRNIFTDFKRHDLGPNFYERNYDG